MLSERISLMLTPAPLPPALLSCGLVNVIVIDTMFGESGSVIVADGAIRSFELPSRVAYGVVESPAPGPFRSTTGAMSSLVPLMVTVTSWLAVPSQETAVKLSVIDWPAPSCWIAAWLSSAV